MESTVRNIFTTVITIYTTILLVLVFSVYLLFEQDKKSEIRVAELENEVAVKNQELSDKIEHESLVYEQLFHAYTMGVQGDW